MLGRRGFLGLAASLAVVPFALSGCVDQHPSKREGTAESIVATSPAVVDICYRLDLDLAGVPKTSQVMPDRYADAQVVGPPMSPDIEILSLMRPDYVISPLTLAEDLRPKYAAAGLPSIFLDLKSVGGMYASMSYLAEKFSRQSEYEQLEAAWRYYMQSFSQSIEGAPAPSVLLLMGVPGSYLVATENSYVGSLVADAGGRNVYEGTGEEFVNANTEDMLSRDPDVILRTAHALPDQIREMFAEEFSTNDIWKHFRAVQEGRVHDLTYEWFGMSATFEYPKAFEELRRVLYGASVA